MSELDLQRAYEELVQVCQRYERENQQLRAVLKKRPAGSVAVAVKPVSPAALPGPGSFVQHVDASGLEHLALVLEVLKGDVLRVKVFRAARKDLILELQRSKDASQRGCWRMRAKS